MVETNLKTLLFKTEEPHFVARGKHQIHLCHTHFRNNGNLFKANKNIVFVQTDQTSNIDQIKT
jgi:hypothetical protein